MMECNGLVSFVKTQKVIFLFLCLSVIAKLSSHSILLNHAIPPGVMDNFLDNLNASHRCVSYPLIRVMYRCDRVRPSHIVTGPQIPWQAYGLMISRSPGQILFEYAVQYSYSS